MPYLIISILFVLLEWLWPRRPNQTQIRRGIITDIVHWAFNGYAFYYLGYSLVKGLAYAWFIGMLRSLGVEGLPGANLLNGLPFVLQFLLFFLVQDFLMWCTHNLLHRVGFLWSIHRVHHSITTMDWIGNMRYHWGEVVVYELIKFLPLMLLGADESIVVAVTVFNTFIGHFNHANLKVDIGPLKYVINSPAMHIWHHDRDGAGSHNVNFGIGLSLWDWIFRTAYMPAAGEPQAPERLGFDGIESFPSTFIGQQLFPLSLAWKRSAVFFMLLLCALLLAAAR
ncbi:MAG TPA: sterol desaturase family protein [Candidatus Kapabacteria bacterium]|nr:sterol desaturase family protein [Candidatus Kapabacteria bacterium]